MNKSRVWGISGTLISLSLFLTSCFHQSTPAAPLPLGRPNTTAAPVQSPATSEPGYPIPSQDAAMLPEARSSLASLASIPQYFLNIQINDHTYQGHARIRYTNNEIASLPQVYFRLLPNGQQSFGNGSLTVSDLSVDRAPAVVNLSNNNSTLAVQLAQPLEPQQTIEIEMDFQGNVPVDFGNPTNSSSYGIYNLTEGVMTLTGWYPILAVYDSSGWNLDSVSWMGDSTYSDTAFYTLEITSPESFLVIASGVKVDTHRSSAGTVHQIVSGPVRDVCVIVVDPRFGMQSSSKNVAGTLVNAYYHPKHKSAGLQALEIAAKSLQTYSQQFGPYPFTEFDVVETSLNHASGVEYPGLVLINSALYDTPEKPDFPITIAHEVAHQWWYSLVGSDPFDHPWLDEALTSYTSSLYYEFSHNRSASQGLINYWQERYDQTNSEGADDRITQTLTHFQNRGDPRFYTTIVYVKGALFFNALRHQVGDTAFFSALQRYFRQYQYQIATPEDLLTTFEDAADRSLDDFYQRWLYSTTRP